MPGIGIAMEGATIAGVAVSESSKQHKLEEIPSLNKKPLFFFEEKP